MRRIWIFGLGAVAVVLWWQPWRRWMQSDEGHRLDGHAAIMPATTSSRATDEHSGVANQLASLASAIPSMEQVNAKAKAVASNAVEKAKNAFAPADTAVSESTAAVEAIVSDAADAAKGVLVPAHPVMSDAAGAPDIASDAMEAAMEASMPERAALSDAATTAQAAVTEAIDTGKDAMDAAPVAVSDIAATAAAVVTNAAEAARGELVPTHVVADEASDAAQEFSPDMQAEITTTDSNVESASAASTPDDLVVIEGVGPKISTVLTGAGIKTFAQLADTDEDTLLALLKDAKIAGTSPATWSRQARLAADGNWEELKQFQEQIKHGHTRHNAAE